jgi:CRISPR/Cas system-associated exonuclease Cas4 (RecB family)
MPFPATFQFSQSMLQDYLDCPRRFQLRYLLQQPWPAVQSEPLSEYERLMELGWRFHQLLRRHNMGLPEKELARTLDDAELRRWWRNYLESPPPDLPATLRRAEVTLSTPLGAHRLAARYDLLAADPGRRVVIVDWKTNQRRPDAAQLARRLQTRVYRYVLAAAGKDYNGGAPPSPEQITMIYWFAEHPAEPEILPYDTSQFAEDEAYLSDLVATIVRHAAGPAERWALTPEEAHCRFCTYRSLCDRGVQPGPLAEFDADQALELDLAFDFDEIDEIAY